MTKYEQADRSIAAYDAALFDAVGRSGQSGRLNLLAAAAQLDCTVAARDRSVNQATRDYYRDRAAFFRTQILEG